MRMLLPFLLLTGGMLLPAAEPVHRLSLEEYEETLRYWEERYPEFLEVERIGESREGMGIFLLKITNQEVSPENKQRCLLTALHGGPERSGTTGCLRIIEWLLGEDPEAAETRSKQEIWILPIINPYAYFVSDRFGNSLKIDPYTGGGIANWDLDTLSFRALDRAPELRAFLETVDRFQPEAHLDLHGTGLQEYPDSELGRRERYQGQIMTEITGSAYSNFSLRPWDWRVTEAMIAAGVEAGFPSDRFEADAQQLFVGSAFAPLASQHWRGRAQFYSAQYGYAKYHTLIGALEIAWEESALARTKGWLRFGNGVADGEFYSGYPVDTVKAFVGHFVTSSGSNASERRACRISLWQRQAEFSQGFLYPQTDGRIFYVVSTSKETRELLVDDLATFQEKLLTRESINHESIAEFIEAGPEIKLAIEKGKDSSPLQPPATSTNEHGIGFRLRAPYTEVSIEEVCLNGHPLPQSEHGGYTLFTSHGFTHVQVSLDEDQARVARDLFLISLRYRPAKPRSIGWKPPREVLDRLAP